MTDSAPDASTWHLGLGDSVHALGAAASELRAAHSSARTTARAADPARIIPAPGLLTVRRTGPARPHDEALWELRDLYMVVEHHARDVYENAALGYAHGAAWAVAAVLP
jgi:hypothetical protein